MNMRHNVAEPGMTIWIVRVIPPSHGLCSLVEPKTGELIVCLWHPFQASIFADESDSNLSRSRSSREIDPYIHKSNIHLKACDQRAGTK